MMFKDRENIPTSATQRVLAGRMRSYANRFKISEDQILKIVTQTDRVSGNNLQAHILPRYQRILRDDSPELSLTRMIYELEARITLANRRLSKLRDWDSIRRRFTHCIDSNSFVKAKSKLDEIHRQVESEQHSQEMKVYLAQLRSGRDKLMQLVDIHEKLRLQVQDNIEQLTRNTIDWSKKSEDSLCFESDLREYASSVRRTTAEYKERFVEMDTLRRNVNELENEVHELDALKSQLEARIGNVDAPLVLARYELLGREKEAQMVSVTDAVQELIRQLAHKRNILAPKLNELNTLRNHVHSQAVAIRERERESKIMRNINDESEPDVDALERFRNKLLQDSKGMKDEIEFLKDRIAGKRHPGLPNLSPDEVIRVLDAFERLSNLLHIKQY